MLINMSFSDFSFSLEFCFPPFPRGEKLFMPFLLQGRPYQGQAFAEQARSLFWDSRLVSAVTTPPFGSEQLVLQGTENLAVSEPRS